MKKKIILAVIAALFSNLVFANSEKVKGNGNVTLQSKTVNSFNKIATGGSIDIAISQGNQEGVTIETDENLQQYIITEVKDNTLSIHVKDNISLTSTKLKVKIDCKKLEAISAGG